MSRAAGSRCAERRARRGTMAALPVPECPLPERDWSKMPKSRLIALVCLVTFLGAAATGCSGRTHDAAPSSTAGPTVSSGPSTDGSSSGSASGAVASLSPSRLLSDTQDAAASAGSVHLSGTRTDTAGRTVSFDETGTMDGSNLYARSAYAAIVYEVLIVDGSGYVRGNAAYWTQEGKLTADQTAAIGDKWVKVDSSLRDQIQQMSPRQSIQNIFSTLSAADFGPVVGVGEASGVSAYTLSDGAKNTVVAATATMLPIQLSTSGSSLSCDTWNSTKPNTAPAADQVIDTSSSASPAAGSSVGSVSAAPGISASASAAR